MHSMHYLIMGLCTGAMMGFSMGFGKFLTVWLPNMVENCVGAAILACLGLWQIRQRTRSPKHGGSREIHGKPARWPVQLVEDILGIAEEPLRADQDCSGSIDTKEAWLLGIALGLDALGAGLGTSVAGFSMLLIPVAAAASPAFVYVGTVAGRFSGLGRRIGESRFLTGSILIITGVAKLFC